MGWKRLSNILLQTFHEAASFHSDYCSIHYGKAINEGRAVHEATFKIAWSVKIGG